MLKEIAVEITVKEIGWQGDTFSHVEYSRSTPLDIVDDAAEFTSEVNDAVATAENRVREELDAQRRLVETRRETMRLTAVPDDPA